MASSVLLGMPECTLRCSTRQLRAFMPARIMREIILPTVAGVVAMFGLAVMLILLLLGK